MKSTLFLLLLGLAGWPVKIMIGEENGPIERPGNLAGIDIIQDQHGKVLRSSDGNVDGPSQEDQTTRIFRVSFYCPGPCCCPDTSDGITASGHRITEADYGTICAAPKKYRFGTVFDVSGLGKVECQDRGGKIQAAGSRIKGADGKWYTLDYDRLDILVKDHPTALKGGIQYLKGIIIGAKNERE